MDVKRIKDLIERNKKSIESTRKTMKVLEKVEGLQCNFEEEIKNREIVITALELMLSSEVVKDSDEDYDLEYGVD